MPVTHGVAGSSPVQTAKIGEALWKQSAFLPKIANKQSLLKKHLRLVVLFSPEMGGLVVRPMKSFPYKRDGFFALYEFLLKKKSLIIPSHI